ncbi:unnamed protein product [Darwinula stevensoni]|uniref:BTB domain-containing protein n=1 Tax=Darwinula stevensoni TaxID=69355 RepID=A0A7R8WY87_9CRUS|nr:unnamed protein product [Darwinula stevensoni]CAG0879065.1 unnamed protein product [Darwinula stevensoni]
MDNEQPDQELVKCVVVGDTAVGKTRLICARACNQRVSLPQLLTKHVPTVWAIDQYRICKEVLERSREIVDGVNVTLRLWDTFGDHDKDRRFAYGRSDVVLLCFSIANPASLKNCAVIWYPEIRKFCPNTPVVLVGCKNDTRFLYMDEDYLRFCRGRSPFIRPVTEDDIVMPDEGKRVAQELGIPYYESSVLTYYGVNEVFENAIRAALYARRSTRFRAVGLKRVQRPLLQVPFCPPKPPVPEITIPPSCLQFDLETLFRSQAYTDLILLTGSVGFSAHRFLLTAAWPALAKILLFDFSVGLIPSPIPHRRLSETPSVVSSTGGESTEFNQDTESLLPSDSDASESSSSQSCRLVCFTNRALVKETPSRQLGCHGIPGRRLLHEREEGFYCHISHPGFQSVRIEKCEGLDNQGKTISSVQTIVSLNPHMSDQAVASCLHFLYTGHLDGCQYDMEELKEAADCLEIPQLSIYLRNMCEQEEYLNPDITDRFRQNLCLRLQSLCLGEGTFSDVLFELEGGICQAHRPLLMARCDVMAAMFRGDFRESSAKVVSFPGVMHSTFRQLLHYLYTDTLPHGILDTDWLPLIELANRLCLPRLVTIVEQSVILDLGQESMFHVLPLTLQLLEPCQMHNADQLTDWILSYLTTHYNEACRECQKLLRNLHPENQAYLNKQRWPPVWYLKDYDAYDRSLTDRMREEKPIKPLKRSRNNSGCLCFSGKFRRNS